MIDAETETKLPERDQDQAAETAETVEISEPEASETPPPNAPVEPSRRKRGRPPKGTQVSVRKFFPKVKRPIFDVPGELLEYWRKVWEDPTLRDRLTVYLYRTWPPVDFRVLMDEDQRAAWDRTHKARDGGVYPSRQLRKYYTETPATHEDLLNEFGSGGYHIKLNDSATNKTVCMTTFQDKYLLWDADRPPLVDPRAVLWDNPSCASYISFLKSRGLPAGPNDLQEQQEEEDMANTQVAEAQRDTIGVLADANKELTNKVIDMASKQNPAPPPAVEQSGRVDAGVVGQAVLEVMKSTHQQSMDMIREGSKATADPVATVTAVVGLVKEILDVKGGAAPPAAPTAPDGAGFKDLLDMQNKHTDALVGLLKEELATERARAAAATVAAANPAPAPGNGVTAKTGLSGVIEELEGLNKLKELLGVTSGEEGAPAPKGFTGALLNGLQSMLTSMGPQVGTLLMGWFQSRALDARAREVAAYNQAVAQGGKPADLIPPVSLSQAPAPVVQQVPNPPQVNGGGMQVTPEMIEVEKRATVAKVKPLFMKYLLSGQSGADFAGTLLDMMELLPKGPGSIPPSTQLDLICAQGVESLRATLVEDADLAKLYQSKPQPFDKFLDEFVRHQEIWDKEEG